MRKSLVLLCVASWVGVAGCNDSRLIAAAVESPAPTATPAPADQPPVAQIAGANTWAPLATAAFDGTSSYDPDGTVTAWAWAITARPAGSVSQVQVNPANPALINFFVDLAGSYTLELTVTDNDGLTGTQQIVFSAVPSQDLHVELTWANQYTQADMDLHLIDEGQGGIFWDYSFDCDWLTCKASLGQNLDWWQAGLATDNPRLDIDNIAESVPENINIDQPHDGAYRINVHYYSSHTGADIPVDLTVNVYLGGALAWSGQRTLTTTDQVWDAAEINWSAGAGTVTPIDGVFVTLY